MRRGVGAGHFRFTRYPYPISHLQIPLPSAILILITVPRETLITGRARECQLSKGAKIISWTCSCRFGPLRVLGNLAPRSNEGPPGMLATSPIRGRLTGPASLGQQQMQVAFDRLGNSVTNRVRVKCARNLNVSSSRDRKVSWSKLTVNYSGFEPPQEGHLRR